MGKAHESAKEPKKQAQQTLKDKRSAKRASNPALSGEARTFAQDRAADDDRRRFIPAHAGNTSTTSSWSASTTVHPRARGEHRVARRWRHRLRGSSPRTRGTRP